MSAKSINDVMLDVRNASEKNVIEKLLKIICKSIQQLHALHVAGWVHGDVRPDNIIVDENETVFLIDWLTLGYPGSPEFVANGMNFFAADERFFDFNDVFKRGKRTHEFRFDIESLAYSILSLTDIAGKLFLGDFQNPGEFFTERKEIVRYALGMENNPILQGAARLREYALEMKEGVGDCEVMLSFFSYPRNL